MSAPIVVTNDPAVTVTQDSPAITAVVPVATLLPAPFNPLNISLSTPLVSGVDFNTVIIPGFYYTPDTTALNTPVGSQFWYLNVDVDGANPATYCRQIATTLTLTPGATYLRTLVNGVWGAWQQVVLLNSSNQLPAVDGSLLTNIPLLPRDANGGRLNFVSTGQVAFVPSHGGFIQINGQLQPIPSAGIILSNTGLVALTLYYVYAFMSAGVLTLEASTTTHVISTTAGNVGNEIKSGDDTRSLVGMLQTGGSSQFVSGQVLSWANRQGFAGTITQVGPFSSAAITPQLFSSAVTLLNWANEPVFAAAIGAASASSTAIGRVAVYLDSAGAEFGPGIHIYTNSVIFPFTVGGFGQPSEGAHIYYFGGFVISGSGTLQWNNPQMGFTTRG